MQPDGEDIFIHVTEQVFPANLSITDMERVILFKRVLFLQSYTVIETSVSLLSEIHYANNVGHEKFFSHHFNFSLSTSNSDTFLCKLFPAM